MSLNIKCAACGHQVPFKNKNLETETTCPGCQVLLRRRSLEDEMAMPVSMALPDQFEQADLRRVPKHSQELIHRYQKNNPNRLEKAVDPHTESNLILAKAIDHLTQVIETALLDKGAMSAITAAQQSLEKDREESGKSSKVVPILNEQDSSTSKTHLPEENERAEPVASPVLVRSEAAAQAHHFQRRTQSDTDIKGPRKNFLTQWVEHHPFVMLTVGLSLLIALVVVTTIFMRQSINGEEIRILQSVANKGDSSNNPNFDLALQEARGFLDAIALNPARPHIFRANAIGPKLEKFYRPLPDPTNYQLELTGRKNHGNKSVYYYKVISNGGSSPLVVLQEKDTFKVFWEFGAGVGDISWDSFLDDEPTTPVLMRAFLRPDDTYDSVHKSDKWSCWLAENWDGSRTARTYVRLGSVELRRLTSALQEYPVRRFDNNWVMAQVKLKHTGTGVNNTVGAFESAEVLEVPLASWLPKEFEPNSTFYGRKDLLRGSEKDNQGLKRRQKTLGR